MVKIFLLGQEKAEEFAIGKVSVTSQAVIAALLEKSTLTKGLSRYRLELINHVKLHSI
jgi:hypothetical protein